MLYDFSDNQTLSELSDYIAVIRIDTVDGVATADAQSGNNLRVKNNVTGEWEKVSDIVYLGQPQKTVSDAAFD